MKIMLILDIGCGRNKFKGSVGIDRIKLPDVDILCDISSGFPFRPKSFDQVECHHVIEHLDDSIALMRNIHSILKPGGILRISFPIPNTTAAWVDPTHKRPYSVESMRYFCKEHNKNYYFDFSFQWVDVFFHTGYEKGQLKTAVEKFLNLHELIGGFFSRHPRFILFNYAEPIVILRKPK